MLFIDHTFENNKHAQAAHLKFWRCRITKKTTGVRCKNEECEVCPKTNIHYQSNRSKHFDALVAFLMFDNRIETIIKGKNDALLPILEALVKSVGDPSNLPDLKADLKAIFDYNWFIGLEPDEWDYSAYSLAENLDRRSCTYCNRTYTTTKRSKSNGKLMRPQFDHWLPKSEYPLFAISFYNLIPSCGTCNSGAKGSRVFDPDFYIHPYVNDCIDDLRFTYEYDRKIDRFNITVISKDKNIQRTLDDLQIAEMYNAHHSELNDLLMIKQAYSEQYIQKMTQFFPETGFSEEEIFRMLFGTEIHSNQFHKRPMSKFKHDILKELGIIT